MDVVAIQDANKIRVAMGLAPLPVPGEDSGLQFKSKDSGDESDENDMSTLEKRAAAAGDNWKRLQDEEAQRKERLARKEALKKARDAEMRNAKLHGRGLGDIDGDADLDTKSWLMQQKKRQKKIDKARKYEEEQAEVERQAQSEYTAKDLAGVKVGHELDQFGDDGEQVLTLKDTAIGDESEEDELENLDLRAKERLEEKLERKKNKPVYNPNDTDDPQRSILAQYDEEIDGKKNKTFTLDTTGAIDQQALAAQREAQENAGLKGRGIKISLDILKDETPTSDYQDPSTAKIRKPKKSKKAKTTRQKAFDEDDIIPTPAPRAPADNNQMDIDGQPSANGTAKKRALEFDDDDLQAKLAEQRRQALKKRKKTDAAELARRIRDEESVTPMQTVEDDEEPGLVIDETTEFVSNLRRPQSASPDTQRRRATSTPTVGHQDGDTTMAESYAAVEDEEEVRARRDAEEREASEAGPVTSTGFEAEDVVASGAGAAMNMLRKRGLIQDTGAAAQNASDRARTLFLAENRALIAEYDAKTKEQREKDRQSGKFDRMSHREREDYSRKQNENRESFLASLQAEHFKRSYRPDVKLRYNDEFGREMNQKEAFKHLSHMFHGKGSGKQKTEKRLKKIEDEKSRDSQASLDASRFAGINEAVGATARKNRQAGVRLQ